MVLSTMTGVVTAQFIASYFGGGTIMTPSPGSIISMIALSPGVQAILINLLSFAVGTGAAFGIATALLLTDKKRNAAGESASFTISDEGISFATDETKEAHPSTLLTTIKSIVVACEAGMGSSAMASGIIKK